MADRKFAALCRVAATLLLLALPAVVQSQDYTWTTNNGAITITGYTGPGGAVTIPDRLPDANGLPVTSIGNSAFYSNSSLSRIMIPASVTNIGNYAFYWCESLTNITIPDGVTGIGIQAFSRCTSLTSMMIPNSLTKIEDLVFAGCWSLNSITIGTNITTIGYSAFLACYSATNIVIPDSVSSVGGNAFNHCDSLTKITIPIGVTNIGNAAFGACNSLTEITVDPLNSFYSSADGVLFDNSHAKLVQFPGGKAGSYTIPNSVTNIGKSAFLGCAKLAGLTIPNTVTIVGIAAFESCTSLTNISIPNTVTSIPICAFWRCTSLTNITIPASITIIGLDAFWGCSRLRGVYFAGNAPSLAGSVFSSTDNLTVYYLPGTTGWGATFGDRPTAPWLLPNPLILNRGPGFGMRTNGFSFIISWATNLTVVVDASTNLANPIWFPLQSCTLTNGSLYFSDPDWTQFSRRFYRIRWP